MNKIYLSALPFALAASFAIAEEQDVQDMSNPLSIYTQAGIGFTDQGVNLKVGATYSTGVDTQMGMNIFEVKGFAGEAVGWSGSSSRTDAVDSIRLRNFEVDLTNGRGGQFDLDYSVAEEVGTASYAMIQALPALGPVSFFPLAGAGFVFGNNLDQKGLVESNGYTIPGTLAVVGTYSKITITDKIWLNYNPMYLQTLSGTDVYKNHFFGLNNDSILTHEFTASYQISPRFNARYFANWSEYTDFTDGAHRIEFNYQF